MLGDVPQSSIRSAPQFSLRSREKFGNPMLKAVDPTTTLEPGPGHYKPRVVNPQEGIAPSHAFPKSSHPRDKAKLAPGPGTYPEKRWPARDAPVAGGPRGGGARGGARRA